MYASRTAGKLEVMDGGEGAADMLMMIREIYSAMLILDHHLVWRYIVSSIALPQVQALDQFVKAKTKVIRLHTIDSIASYVLLGRWQA